MGFKRKMGEASLGLALVASSVGVRATTAAEPLVVTQLSDPETRLVAVDGSSPDSALDVTMASFAQAISRSVVAEEQAAKARCISGAAIPATHAARLSWEAYCRYRRR